MKEETLGKILSQSPVFSGASHDTLARLCSCNVRGFRGGETIYSPASFFRGIGMVISGTLAVHGKNGERDILLRTIDKGGDFRSSGSFRRQRRICEHCFGKEEKRGAFCAGGDALGDIHA